MTILSNHSLKNYNSFGINVTAKAFAAIDSVEALKEVLRQEEDIPFILGGGSNILLTGDLDRLVIKNDIKGKQITRRFKKSVHVAVGAGENWHQLVLWCIENNLGGIENLSLIPGTVGAAPIQNIGAYGVELQEVFHQLEAVELSTGKVRVFKKEACKFAYRDSIFKRQLRGQYCITKVYFRLTHTDHTINSSYGAIRDLLAKKAIIQPTIRDISEAVIQIRSSKLPDPAELGNSGSFFKNPEISRQQFSTLQKRFPHIIFYPLPSGKVKIPAGWLIEQCGWKGKRIGNTGAHKDQALVLVNYGGATGKEIAQLAIRIQNSVNERFGIRLQVEVNIL